MVFDLFSLKNKTVVVTGANGLLGKEHCIALSEAGADVIAVDLNEIECKEIASSLENNSIGTYCDVTSPDSVKKLRDDILTRYGKIDVLVNNAAINDKYENPASVDESMFENYSLENWQQSLNVNITGTFLCSQILGKEMLKIGKGNIINIASTYGIVAPDQSLYLHRDGKRTFYKTVSYPVTKGAVIAFTKFLAAYWGNKGIRVNALSPGGVENNQDNFFIEKYSKKTPLCRMALPNDYKGAIVFLASDASAYMTGANLIVDGGWTIW